MPRATPGLLPALFLASTLAGCLGGNDDPPPTPTPTAYPNFLGDWSSVPGTLFAHRVRGDLVRYNATHASIPWPDAACTVFPFASIDPARRVLNLSSLKAFHPTEPAPLVTIVVGEWHRHGCRLPINGAHGINELPRTLELPIPGSRIWWNATLQAGSRDDAGFEFVTEAGTFGGNESATYSLWTQTRDAAGYLYRMNVTLQPYGHWPFSSVHRFGPGVNSTSPAPS